MPTTHRKTARPSKPAPPTTREAATEMQAPAAEAAAQKTDPATREAMIRLVAYRFYERRGLVGGHELEDWLEAEMEVDRQLAVEPKPDVAI
jgi:hypothetical protein